MNRLYVSVEDFKASLDRGIELIMGSDLLKNEPDAADKDTLKALLASYMTGIFDPEKLAAPSKELDAQIGLVRMTLLAGYNLGRQRGNFPG